MLCPMCAASPTPPTPGSRPPPTLTTVGPGSGQVSSGTGWHYDSRGWVEVPAPCATSTGLSIPYNVDITASNVTLDDDDIVTSGRTLSASASGTPAGDTIENSTISGPRRRRRLRRSPRSPDVYGDSTSHDRQERQHLRLPHRRPDGQRLASPEGNYIHDPGYIAGDHTDGINSAGGSTVPTHHQGQHRLRSASARPTPSAYSRTSESRPTASSPTTCGAGGSYAIYAGQNTGGPEDQQHHHHRQPDQQHLLPARQASARACRVAAFNAATTTWTGNVWAATGRAIPAPSAP